MEIIIIEADYRAEIIERDIKLEEIKLRVAYLAENILKKSFPENYKEDSNTKVLIDLISSPIEIITITNNDPATENRIGKIELNLEIKEEEYSITPIITIWAIPLEEPINMKVF